MKTTYKCICGKDFSQSNILGKHKLNCGAIKIATENAPFCTCGKKLGYEIHNGILKYKTNCGSTECRKIHSSKQWKGTTWSEERKKNAHELRTWYKEKIIKYGNYACDKCGSEFDSSTGIRSHKSSCGKEEKHICEICNKTFKNKQAYSVHKTYSHSDKSAEYKEIFRKNGLNCQIKMRGIKTKPFSKLEKRFEKEFLSKFNIKYVPQFFVKAEDRNYFYDFYIEEHNLIIEVDGDYWHINPIKYKFEEMPIYIQEYKKIEEMKQKEAIDSGYRVIRFWEYDIINNKKEIEERLEECLQQN